MKIPRFVPASAGFTRTELIAVVTVLVLVAWLAPRALGRSGPASSSLVCMDNLRRLATAWMIYTDENSQTMVGNYHGGQAINPVPGRGAWALGWLDWSTSPANTNTALLVDPAYGALSPYLDADPTVFQCPEDRYVSKSQAAWGWLARARSYAANGYMGPGNLESGPMDPGFIHYTSLTQLRQLSPAAAFVFTEEHPDSQNDPLLFVSMAEAAWRWIDLPGSFHDGAGWFTFADGHLELHPWQNATTVRPVRVTTFSILTLAPGDADLAWVRERTSEPY